MAVICLFCGTGAVAQDSLAISQLAEKWVHGVYKPAFSRFAVAANQWAASSEDLCESTRGSRIYELQTTFTRLIASYSRVDVFRSGPLHENNLRNRLFYWPDTRRVGERQLRALLAEAETTTDMTVQQLSEKSVALQGFPALERLLFSHSYQAVEIAPQCHVVKTIVKNIALMASELDLAWQSQSAYVQAFLRPTPISPYFRTEDEVIRSVMTEVVVGLNILIDRKLQPLLSGDPVAMRTTPLWQSQRTVAMLHGNTSGIRSLLFDSGLLRQMGLEEELSVDFDYVDYLLEKLKYEYSFADENGTLREDINLSLTSLSAVLNGIRFTVKQQVLVPLGIGVSFNAGDGD